MKEKNILYKNTDFPEWKRAIIPNIAAGIFLIALFIFLFLFSDTDDIYLRIFILVLGLFVGFGIIATIPIVVLDDKGIHYYTLLFGKKIWYDFYEYNQIARVIFNKNYALTTKLQYLMNENLKKVFFLTKVRKGDTLILSFFTIRMRNLPNFSVFLKILESKEVLITPMPPEYFHRLGKISIDLEHWLSLNTQKSKVKRKSNRKGRINYEAPQY